MGSALSKAWNDCAKSDQRSSKESKESKQSGIYETIFDVIKNKQKRKEKKCCALFIIRYIISFSIWMQHFFRCYIFIIILVFLKSQIKPNHLLSCLHFFKAFFAS